MFETDMCQYQISKNNINLSNQSNPCSLHCLRHVTLMKKKTCKFKCDKGKSIDFLMFSLCVMMI